MKVVLQYRATPGFRRQVDALNRDWLRVLVVDESDKTSFSREMTDADVLLHVLEPVTTGVIDAAPKLRFIQKLGIGVDTIDLAAARARAVAVCNIPGANTAAVAEHTLLLMLATLRRLTTLHDATRAGHGWHLEPDTLDALGELGGRRVGLVGFGAVARRLAPIVKATGATVLYHARTEVSQDFAVKVPLAELLRSCDIVSLHLPLTADTARMMNALAFAAMKRGAILINTARGGLIDEPALIDALDSGQLLGAGLDVFASEPIPPDHPFLHRPNVIVTPHVAWYTSETLQRGLAVFLENCRRLRDGEALLNRVV
jgi:phosphoglycerate dehydrogenase-like enzyme